MNSVSLRTIKKWQLFRRKAVFHRILYPILLGEEHTSVISLRVFFFKIPSRSEDERQVMCNDAWKSKVEKKEVCVFHSFLFVFCFVFVGFFKTTVTDPKIIRKNTYHLVLRVSCS